MLFLGHGAERTGPPVYLRRILAGLRAVPTVEASVVLLEGGPLLEDLRSLAPTVALTEQPDLASLAPADVVVVNTAGSIRALDALPWTPRRLVTHVHELAVGFELHLDPALRQRVLAESDEIWVVADAVGQYLTTRHGVEPERLRRHRGVLDATAFTPPTAGERTAVRAELGVPPGAVLVGGSGTLDWRKAPDLFLQVLARARRSARADVHAVWIGGAATGPWGAVLDTAAEQLGVSSAVHVVPETDLPHRLFGALDLFALASREDAYPLVCLEAAALGTPVVAFDAGGTTELVGDDAGVVVAYPDVEAMAAAVATLADDPGRRAQLGEAARRAARTHTVEHALPALVADLRRVATSAASSPAHRHLR